MNSKSSRVAVPEFQIPAWLRPHVGEVRAWPAVSGPGRVCQVEGCGRGVRALGLCTRHYDRARALARRAGLSTAEWVEENAATLPLIGAPAQICWVAACDRTATQNGLCKAHHELTKYHFRQQPAVGPASD